MAAKGIYYPPMFEDVDNIDVWLKEIDDKQQGQQFIYCCLVVFVKWSLYTKDIHSFIDQLKLVLLIIQMILGDYMIKSDTMIWNYQLEC